MKELWIENSGLCAEGNIKRLLLAEKASNSFFIAGLTDQYVSGHATSEEIEMLEVDKLLEIRIFSVEREFCASRSMLGHEFGYRIASDEALYRNFGEMQKCDERSPHLPEQLEANYVIRYQYIDINEVKSQCDAGENGSRELMTTGGGKYSLPISKGTNMVKIMTYVTYDENGMAKIADNRLCGFIKEEDRDAAR